MPVFNELQTIEQIVARVRSVSCVQELIIVDDCSDDGTRTVVMELARLSNVLVILHDRNRGKGAALRTGFAAATGDLVVVQDADAEYDPADYVKLIQPILDDKADVVYGSRFVGRESRRVLYFWHSVGNRLLTLLSNAFTNLNLSDMETCYKVFRRAIVQSLVLEEERFGFDPEITGKIAALPGCRVYEVGISYVARTYEEGKKVTWRDGLRAVWCVWKYRPNNRRLAGSALAVSRLHGVPDAPMAGVCPDTAAGQQRSS